MTGTDTPFALHYDDHSQTARMLPLVVWPVIILITLVLSAGFFVLPENALRWAMIILSLNALGLLSLWLGKRGRARLGATIFVGALWALLAGLAWTAGGVRASAVNSFPVVVLIAGLLLGARAGVVVAALCGASGLVVLWAEWRGFLPANRVHHTPLSLWLINILLLAIVVGLQRLAANAVQNALRRSETELAERRRVETELRHSEQKFRAIVEDQSEMIVRWQPDGTRTFVNGAYCRMFGGRYEDFVGSSFYPLVVEEERDMIRRNTASLTPANPMVTAMHRSILPTGEIGWQEWSDRAIFDEQGRLVEFQSVGRDITERKRFEEQRQRSSEQLRALTSRLQTLREDERLRISREIHDQLGQLLTALNLEIHSIKRNLATLPECDKRQLCERKADSAVQLVEEAIGSIQRIAAELRPVVLDRLGLAAAIEAETQAFQSRTGVVSECLLPGDPLAVPPEYSIATFRILQEILTNIARHARATHLEVRLDVEDGELVLEVSDDGVGIQDADLAKPTSLGVVGMKERASMLGGTVSFTRNPDRGTTVTVRLPLPANERKSP